MQAALLTMQSSFVLQGFYCETTCHQLAAWEDKDNLKKNGKLVGNGLPQLLTDDEFMQHVWEHDNEKIQKEAEKVD